MLFSSSIFIFLFLPVTLLGFQALGRFGRRAVFSWLILMSCVFYGYWNPKYLLLLCLSILLNFAACRLIVRFKSNPHSQSLILVSPSLRISSSFSGSSTSSRARLLS